MRCACNANTAPRFYVKVARTKQGPQFIVKDRETTACTGVNLVVWEGVSIGMAMSVARYYNRTS